MRLFAKVNEPELLLRSLNEAGMAFYRVVEGCVVEAVYFSASRCIYFFGGLTSRQLETLKAQAYPAREFVLNERSGEVEVSQLE